MRTEIIDLDDQQVEVYYDWGWKSTNPLGPDDDVEQWGPIIESVKDELGEDISLDSLDLAEIEETIESRREYGLTPEIEMEL